MKSQYPKKKSTSESKEETEIEKRGKDLPPLVPPRKQNEIAFAGVGPATDKGR